MAEQKEHVKAYIKVTGHKYAWMLECGGGRLYGDGEGSSCSVNRKLTAIEALADMLGHMKRGVMFDLKINEINIANYINRGFLGKWKQNGWKTVGGARVKYAEEWKKVRFEPHAFRAEYVRRVGRLFATEKRQEEKAEKTWQEHHAGREILLSVCQILRRLWAKACAEAPHSLRVGKQADIRGAGIDRLPV